MCYFSCGYSVPNGIHYMCLGNQRKPTLLATLTLDADFDMKDLGFNTTLNVKAGFDEVCFNYCLFARWIFILFPIILSLHSSLLSKTLFRKRLLLYVHFKPQLSSIIFSGHIRNIKHQTDGTLLNQGFIKVKQALSSLSTCLM